MRAPLAAVIALAVATLAVTFPPLPTPTLAHELVLDVTPSEAFVLDLSYADGSPFSYESYEIRPEGEEIPFQSGRTDANGRIAFAPGRAGTWHLTARSEDGHGIDTTFETTSEGGATTTRRSWFDRYPRVFAGAGLILGVFGLLQLFARRRGPAVLAALLLLALAAPPASAHHGVASLGVAGLQGPGAPVETSSSATLPAGRGLLTVKLDEAIFDKKTPERDDEGDVSSFWLYGLGWGVKPWLSAYAFVPYTVKRVEDNSFTTAGFTDVSVMAVLGFKLDEGLRLVPANESLDEQEDWHFTVYAGTTLPTGDENVRDPDGAIDPGMALGFGTPAVSLGATVTKPAPERLTWVGELSWIRFGEHEYDDGTHVRFGSELRANGALAVRLATHAGRSLRFDAQLEGNFLHLGRDETDGVGELATGGDMLYVLPGARLYAGSTSVGFGVKIPVWTDLNEDSDQQGGEGTEDVRILATLSALF